jgi:hypothetical protein
LVQAKMITAEEAMAHTMHPEDLSRMLSGLRR